GVVQLSRLGRCRVNSLATIICCSVGIGVQLRWFNGGQDGRTSGSRVVRAVQKDCSFCKKAETAPCSRHLTHPALQETIEMSCHLCFLSNERADTQCST